MKRADEELMEIFKAKGTPYVIAFNKADLPAPEGVRAESCSKAFDRMASGAGKYIFVSALTGEGISELKELIAGATRPKGAERRLVGDLISAGDFVILVVPIDSAAPKGRLILPQQQVIRDVLESGAAAITVRESELAQTLKTLGKKPRLVITDSQVFEKVNKDTPPDIPLTSFSILFARYKGDLKQNADGAAALDTIKDGDKILICEGCTHHRQCDDIGTVKLPRWIRAHTKSNPEFEFTSGGDFPADLKGYKLIVHCGACMLNEREVKHRLSRAKAEGIPITNYGILIAKIHGILESRNLAAI
jgi:[FeFe] hydrogenase H-cluster maturation GTPase HydF